MRHQFTWAYRHRDVQPCDIPDTLYSLTSIDFASVMSIGPPDGVVSIPSPAITSQFYYDFIQVNPDNLGNLIVENSPTCPPGLVRFRIKSYDKISGNGPNALLILPTIDPMVDTA